MIIGFSYRGYCWFLVIVIDFLMGLLKWMSLFWLLPVIIATQGFKLQHTFLLNGHRNVFICLGGLFNLPGLNFLNFLEAWRSELK